MDASTARRMLRLAELSRETPVLVQPDRPHLIVLGDGEIEQIVPNLQCCLANPP